MPSNADRNLLIGILALHMDFIDREQLVAAMSAWVLDKTKSLDAILRGQGALRDDTRELLTALVDKHLEIHGGDPERSLCALSSIDSLREDVQSLADPDIAAAFSSVAANRHAVAPVTTASVGVPTSAGTRFRILRPHAKGGLGVVFVAHDNELNREVALKEIQSQRAHDSNSRARFVMEAEITGRLEHPAIVPVYSFGQYADGRPFYAMRFIRGDSLQDAIGGFHRATYVSPGERSMGLRKLLMRFVDVCQAIEYAHSRGVLHRDLKPGNIMLGRYGETLVVDWGLAKAVGRRDTNAVDDETTLQPISASGSAPTQMGMAIGTPAYMSPEQALGQLSKLGPTSDVYSLGATLYHVLTGQAPFGNDDLSTTLRQVPAGEFRKPRELNPQIAKPLEAICLKAMSLRREDRYRSPAALAEDVEKWLADEPIAAYWEPITVRTRRWVRRHQTLVGSTAAAIAVLLLALGAVAALQAAYAKQLWSKNQDLQAAFAAANKARTEADKSAEIARQQSQLALRSLQSVIFDIQRKLDNVPGARELQRSLLQTAIARLKEVSDSYASRAAIDHNTSVALDDLGDVFLRIGSGNPNGGGNEGALAAARALYQQEFQIRKELVAADPNDARAQRGLSISYDKLGDVSLQAGKLSDAMGFYQKGRDIAEKLAAADPNDMETQRDLSISHNRLGDVSLRAGRMSEALGFYQKGVANREKLAAADPNDTQAQRDLSISYDRLGDVNRQLGQPAEAMGFYQRGMEIDQKLAAADPNDAQAQRDLSISHDSLGDVSLQLNNMLDALGFYEKGLTIREKLAATDSNNAQAQRDLSISHNKLGDVSMKLGQRSAALGYYQKGMQIAQKLAATDLSDARAQRDLFISQNKLGAVSLISNQMSEAVRYFEKGLAIAQSLAVANPSDAQAQRDLVASHANLGEAHKTAQEYAAAARYFRERATVLQRMIDKGLDADWARRQIDTARAAADSIQQMSIALGDWNELLAQPVDRLPMFLEIRGIELTKKGRFGDAAQAMSRLRETGKASAEQLYNAACVYALSAAAVKPTDNEPLTQEQAAQRKDYIERALATLKESIAAGWSDFGQMQIDADLTLLRELPEFQSLLPKGTDVDATPKR
jgi:serine/threonine-protein kinase